MKSSIIAVSINNGRNSKGGARMVEEMSKEELMKISVEEFSRLQKWMLGIENNSNTYSSMHERYVELKVILSNLGVNLAELDRIKE